MTLKIEYVPLAGGMNLIDSQITMKPGALIECLNFEEIFGRQGYNRIDGYERYDGHLEPHTATYAIQYYDNGTGAIAVGDIITGTSSSAEVLAVEGVTASGRLILGNLTGTWADNSNIQVGGVTKAIANGVTYIGSVSEENDVTYKSLAVENRRADINKVPGEGAVLGVAVYNDGVVAVRNDVGSASATMYKSSITGWTAIRTGLLPNGSFRFVQQNFSGASTSLYLFGCDGKNKPFRYNGSRVEFIGSYVTASSTTSMTPATGSKTFTITEASRDFVAGQAITVWSAANPADTMIGTVTSYTSGTNTLIVNVTTAAGASARTDWRFSHSASGQCWGTLATSGTSITLATGAQTLTILESSRGWAVGQTLTAWSAADASKSMVGTVTSYSGNTLVLNVTSITGSGTVLDWIIGQTSNDDKPYDIAAHKDHLFLTFPKGQLQTSNLGDPMVYTSTATLFGMGDEITGLVSTKGNVAAIYCRNRTMLLTGSDKTTWQMSANSLSSGGFWKTAQEIGGTIVALDDRGLTSLQATLNYGSFEMSIFSRLIKPYLDTVQYTLVDTYVVRNKSQYRMMFSNGDVLTCSVLTPNAQITPSDVSFTRSAYLHTPSCAYAGEVLGEEFIVIGTSDGWVMRIDAGTSFDGQAIDSAIRIPYSVMSAPSVKKRYRKMVVETTATLETEIRFRQLFDYSDGNYEASIQYLTTGQSGGGLWSSDEWDLFRWSMPNQGTAEVNIDGVGRGMSLIFWNSSAVNPAFNLQGLLIHYSPMGVAR